MAVAKTADYLIDPGPEGGVGGGRLWQGELRKKLREIEIHRRPLPGQAAKLEGQVIKLFVCPRIVYPTKAADRVAGNVA